MNILDALDDPAVFRPLLKDPATWAGWRAFLAALFALPMTPAEREAYRAATGRTTPPAEPHQEAWIVAGRRGGKSFTLALTAVFLASFRDWRPALGPGERATIMVIAADRRQARTIMRYVVGLLRGVPMLARTIEREAAESIDLRRQVTIEVHTASFRTVRGYSIAAALLDEVAFWPTSDDSSNPDAEIVAALRPAMATVPGSMLLAASSPYARRGALWDAFRRHHGRDDSPVLVWRAPTLAMNPTVPARIVDEALAADPARAAAEYMAEFRTDIESYIAREVVEAAVTPGVRERAPVSGTSYSAFVDPSGGSSDSFTLAIAHHEDGRAVLDAVRERRPPFSPEVVVGEFVALLKRYGIVTVQGDRYAGQWPQEQFNKLGVSYEASARPKSDIYRDLLPLLNSGTAELLDDPRLAAQLVSLERRTARGGRDSIDHPPGAHDDLANAAAGSLTAVAGGAKYRLLDHLGTNDNSYWHRYQRQTANYGLGWAERQRLRRGW